MDLLEKASIILTPTAYNNGEALCVKPSDGSGDFDFSRNSAATRVNAQGLVENVQILSSNLVQNGDFSEEGAEEVSNGSFSQEGAEEIVNGDFDTDSDWGLGNGWSIGGGEAVALNSASGQRLSQDNILQVGKIYKLTYEVKSISSGGFKAFVGGVALQAISNIGVYTETMTTPTINDDFFIRTLGTTTGSIDNVSCVEVGQDWTLDTGWSIGDSEAIHTGAGSYIQQGSLTAGSNYKVEIDVTQASGSGFPQIYMGGLTTAMTSIDTYTFYITAQAGDTIKLRGVNDCKIGSISVKEVGQNWDLGTGWSIGNNVAISDATQGYIVQTDVGGAGVTANYKIQWVQNITAGTRLRFFARNYNDGGNATILSITRDDGLIIGGGNCIGSGTFTAYVSSTNGYSFKLLAEAGVEADISNVTTIQITDDTNLPRINYEGFSYQDALGSEQVVNGNYNESGIGNVISQSGGILVNENNQLKITSNGSSGFSRGVWNTNGLEGQQFLIKADIISVSGSTRFIDISNNQGQSLTQGTTFSTIITLGSATKQVGFGGLSDTSFELVIDNVSVKEYLGQEVVPDSGCGSWLFEPQSTNLVTDSQNYNSTYWGGQRGVLSDGGVGLFYLSPNSNVIKYEVNQTQYNQMYCRLPSNVTIGNTYTQQGYVKCDDAPYIHFQISPLSGNPTIVWDNVNNTVISSDPSIDSYNITSLNDGWVKAEITYTASVSNIYASLKTYFSTSSTTNWAGVPIGTIAYQTFVQVEALPFASSYIPTEGTQKTRNQDVCTNGGSLASINSTEGVIYWEGAKLQEASGTQVLGLSDGSGVNRIGFQTSATANQIRFVVDAGGNQASKFFVLDDITDFNKLALKWKQDDFSFWVNGIKIGTDTSGNVPALNALNTLDFYYGTGIFNFTAKTKALAVWKEALSDEELTELTTI